MAYNGWKNRQTWNVALWLGSDRGLYDLARSHDTYEALRDTLRGMGSIKTPDGVAYNDSGLDTERLDELLKEFNS